MTKSTHSATWPFPPAPISALLAPIQRFLHIEAASGVVLLACTLLALFVANSPWAEWFTSLWHETFMIGIGARVLSLDLLHVVNDGLMSIFFFVVGLEIKRELVAGELRSPRKAALPIVAAIGGMLIPAGMYLALSNVLPLSPETARGWAVPMATDIAFVVGVLALFGSRVPLGLKITILTLAIVDDLGAVLVIALVFTDQISAEMLGLAAGGFVLVALMNRIGVRSVPIYVAVGVCIWLAVLKSGVHPTVAGVLLGLMTPATAWVSANARLGMLESLVAILRGHREGDPAPAIEPVLDHAAVAMRESRSPLARLEHALHPWVAFVIMPVFALANAGVAVRLSDAANPLAIAIAASLALGKPIGIVGFCTLAVKLGIAQLPHGVTWKMLAAGGCLAGIGFTMAIFLATLSLPPTVADAGKLGILGGSLVSAFVGGALLWRALRAPQSQASDEHTRPSGSSGA